MSSFERSILSIKGIGKQRAQLLAKLGIHTIGDLIYHFPKKYISILPVTDICQTKNGDNICIQGIIKKVEIKKVKAKLTISQATISVGEIEILAIWYNQPNMKQSLQLRDSIKLYGKMEAFNSRLYIKVIEIIPNDYHALFLPVYPSTGKGRSNIKQPFWRKIIYDALSLVREEVTESLPPHILQEHSFMPLIEALNTIHFPSSIEDLKKSRFRLIYQELYFYLLQQDKIKNQLKNISHPFKIDIRAAKLLVDLLPVKLTNGQRLAVQDILSDMSANTRMYRLIQGDVGCGKTIVALSAILACISSGFRSVLMVPTEVLAEQHYNTIKALTKEVSFSVSLLTSSSKDRQQTEKLIMEGRADLIIGTQALIQEKVKISNVGLVVIDEQHKFGIEDRDKLVEKCDNAHILMMSATPIPKTLALSLYGDLDLTVIPDMPLGRKPVKTYYVPDHKRHDMQAFIKEKLLLGKQGYWVCPAIEGDTMEKSGVEKTAAQLQQALSPCPVALIHGKLSSGQKETILYDFVNNSVSLLVATTIIEVGVNNPNAIVMVVDGFERFGLAQLHQLRGRVGRGEEQAYCFLLGKGEEPLAKKRLEILLTYRDGFAVAEQDFNLRGPGSIASIRQHGVPKFRLANLIRDKKILERCYQDINLS